MRGSTFQSFNFLLQVCIAFFLTPFVIGSLGDRMYGLWVIVGTLIGYQALLDIGLSSAVHRFIAQSIGSNGGDATNGHLYDDSIVIFNTSLVIFSLIGGVILLITFLVSLSSSIFWSDPGDAQLFNKIVIILGINMAISSPLKVYGGVLMADLRHDLIAIVEFVQMLLRVTLIVVALKSGHGILGLAVATFIAAIPGKILIVYFARFTAIPTDIKLHYYKRDCAKMMFGYGVYDFIGKLADQFRFHADAFVISALLGLTHVTHYRIASLMLHYYIGIVARMFGVISPLYSQLEGKGDLDAIRNILLFSTKVAIYICSFICFGFIFWGKAFIQKWMGPSYLDAYPPLVILTLGTTIALSQVPSVNLLLGTSKHRFLAISHSIEGVFNLALSILLAVPYGILGVAVGTFVPITINKLFFQPWYTCKVSGTSVQVYFFTYVKSLLKAILALLLPTILTIAYIKPDYIVLFNIAIISSILYVSTIFAIGFEKKEKHLIINTIVPDRFRQGYIFSKYIATKND